MKLYLILRALLLALVCALSIQTGTYADPASSAPLPFVNPLMTDNMVLQRGIVDRIWGWTTPGSTVTVQFENKSFSAVAGPDGLWIASIGPYVAGGPYTMTISGPQSVTVSNVVVGDVWLCSGQSNMEFGIGNGINSAQEIAAANYPNIRIFTVAKDAATSPQSAASGMWQAVTPESIANQGTWNGFSAVGYFFGRDLQSTINVPIGLIQSSWGGTPAEAWTSSQALLQFLPEFTSAIAQINPVTTEPVDQQKADWYTKNDPGVAGNWQSPTTDLSTWNPIAVPGYFQSAGIPELAGINGIVWFRRTFDLPAADTGKDGVLHILVDDNDTTWINGKQIGATEGFNNARSYTVPAALLQLTGNVITVRDLDTGGSGGIYGDPAALTLAFDGATDIPLAGTWQYRLGAALSTLPPYPSTIAGNPDYPTLLFNGMINPIDLYGIKGALWYQGEANAGNALQYRTLLPAMITDWRSHWAEGDFPFLIVQLAGWQPGGPNWAELRQAQWLTAQGVPNAGIVTAVDIGNEGDIHPKNKQEVGRRLALVAEAKVYGLKVPYSGPVYKNSIVKGGTIQVSFDQLDGGLIAQGGLPLTGFEIAGADGKFVAADASINKNTIAVSSPAVPTPVAVQYDWSSYPNGNLYNKADLPAFPFKTDEK